jgi:glycosyltransferase involved in cell wall biosynthesis
MGPRVRYAVADMARVSVIIPAWNAERYIGDTIESALGQTLAAEEIIVVDDGSTDGTAALARSYPAPVTVVSERVGGPGAARNLGASRSRGEWLAFLDADDLWLPEKLERQLAKAGPDTALICSDRYNIGERGALPAVQGTIQPQVDGDVFEHLLQDGNFITTSTVVLRRAVFDEMGGFSGDARLVGTEDWDLWMRVTARYPIAACTEPLTRYRLHAGGLSRRVEHMLQSRELVVERALDLPRGRALSPITKRRIWAATYRTNGWDAGRSRRPLLALRKYVRSLVESPLQAGVYADLARVLLGRL